MTEINPKNRRANFDRLIKYGFIEQNGAYAYSEEIAAGQMILTVLVKTDGRIYSAVTDKSDGGEYVLHLIPDAVGRFVGRVRDDYESALGDILSCCFDIDVFKSSDALSIIEYARKKYGSEPEYLWQKFPDNAVLRRSDTKKWYAAILTVTRDKLELDGKDKVEILDLRISPEQIEQTVDGERYFKGYHMNKRRWYTLLLDSGVPLDEIFARIDESYELAR